MSLRKTPDRVTDMVFLALALSLVIAGVHLIVNSGITGRFVVGDVGSAPHVVLASPASGSMVNSGVIDLVCDVTSADVSNITLFTNRSGSWSVESVSHVSGGSVSAAFSLEGIADGSYAWNCLAYDSSGYSSQAASDSRFSIDSASPEFSALQGSSDVVIYSGGMNYSFNVSCSDSGSGIRSTWFVLDGRNTTLNISAGMSNMSFSIFMGNLAAGNHSYSWSAADNAGNLNTVSSNISVIRAVPSLLLRANSSVLLSVVEGSLVNITSEVSSGEGALALYIDGNLVGDGVSVNKSTNFQESGVRNITAVYLETQNYSGRQEQLFIFVTSRNRSLDSAIPADGYVSGGDVYLSCAEQDVTGITMYSNVSGSWAAPASVSGSNISYVVSASEGEYAWGCVVDDVSSFAGLPRIFRIDLSPPAFSALPANMTVNYSDALAFSSGANDPSGIAAFYMNDSRFVISSSGVIGFVGLPEVGSYDLLVTAEDIVNNSAGSLLSVMVVDEIPPVVSLVAPRDGDLIRDSTVLECSASDLSLSDILVYSNASGSWAARSTVVNLSEGGAFSDTGLLHEGEYVWNCLASDGSLSSSAPSNRTFEIAGEKTVGISGTGAASAPDSSSSDFSSSGDSTSGSSGGSGAGICMGVSCPDRCELDYLKQDGSCIVVDGRPFCRFTGGELCDHGCRDAACLPDPCGNVECAPLKTVCSDGSISQCVPQCSRGNCLSCVPSCPENVAAGKGAVNETIAAPKSEASRLDYCGDGICSSTESPFDCSADCREEPKSQGGLLVVLVLSVLVLMIIVTSYTVYTVFHDSRQGADLIRLNPTKQDAIGIDSFIRSKILEGVSPEELRSMLISKGWPANIVGYYVQESAAAKPVVPKHAKTKKNT